MRISELEKALRDGMRNFPGRPALALLAGDGIEVPPVFADSAKSLASRSSRPAAKDSRARAQKDNWI
jgi:hypothetical protein